MADDRDLEGLDPYALMAAEAARIDAHLARLDDAAWAAPSRCAGWSVRDVVAHLAASEEYNRASLDGTVQQFLADMGAKGATDLASANEIGIRGFDGVPNEEIRRTWRTRVEQNRKDFAARDGGTVDTTVGAYPARWQAFHLAFELATHHDDIGAPVSASEANERNAWQARFGRFALKEMKPELRIEARDGRTHVQGQDIDVDLDDADFVQAVAARLPGDSGIDAATAAVLSATP